MGTHKLAGFTIIETMLVLTVTAVLIVSLLVGIGNSLNVQRYRDAAETFKSLLQQQYATLNSVQNGRDGSQSCGTDASITDSSSAPQKRGQSNCVIIGRYLRVVKGDISAFTVIGSQNNPPSGKNDIKSLSEDYTLNVDQAAVEQSTMEWGTQIAWPAFNVDATSGAQTAYPKPKTPRSIGILFIRSPDSGQIYTFTSDNVPASNSAISSATFKDLLKAGVPPGRQGARTICIDTKGLLASNDRAVYLNSFASSASAVELQANGYMLANNIGVQC